MSDYRTALSRLTELLDRQPQEPYAGRKRRPSNYRDKPEYRQWINEQKAWAAEVADWHRQGIEAYGNDRQAGVALYGEPVPGTIFVKRPAGWVSFAGNQDEPEPQENREGWAPRTRIPGERESLDKVFEDDEKSSRPSWTLKTRVEAMLRSEGINVYDEFIKHKECTDAAIEYAREMRGICRQAKVQWATAAKRLLDPGAIARLRKWTGQKAERNLLNHNLAIISAGPLQETARTNPGALAWWMRSFEEMSIFRPDMIQPLQPIPFPEHPGEIIAQVRREYAEAGGNRWKTMASQPAGDTALLLERHGRKPTAWLTEALSEAPPPPLTGNAEQLRFEATPAPHAPPDRVKPVPAAPQEVKRILAELYESITGKTRAGRYKRLLAQRLIQQNPQEKELNLLALKRVATLSLRHYAGAEPALPNTRARENLAAEFEDLADYIFSEPQAAARAGTWKGLKKASRRWHGARNLEFARQQLAKEAEEKEELLSGWETPIRRMTSESGFQAIVLTSARELVRESKNLSHCVGGRNYADMCVEGRTRIVHLEPDMSRPENKNAPERKGGTTLEISYIDHVWRQGQHRGRANRIPDAEERKWAAEFLNAWKQAMTERRRNRPLQTETEGEA